MREVSTASRKWIVIGVGSSLVWTVAKIAIPLLALQAVEQGVDPYDGAALARWSLAIVGATLVVGAFTYVRRYSAFAISLRAEAELRRRLFDHLQRLHFAYHDRAQIGELMARVSTDAKQVQMLLVFIPIAGANILMVVGVSVVLFVLNVKLAIVALAPLPVLFVAAMRFSKVLHPVAMRLQERLADVSRIVEESLSGIRVVKGFGAEAVQNAHLSDAAERVYERGMAMGRLRGLFNPLLEVLPSLGLVAVLFVGGREVINGDLELAALITFNLYILQLVFPLRMTSFMVAQVSRASASAQRVNEILATEPEIVERKDAQPLPDGAGEVRFEGVTFGYRAGAPVLRDLDLVIAPGESVALVGATGSGKSTVARLVPRFYDVEAGRVLLDGVDVRDLRLSDLRDAVGIVFEDTFLFTDTVRANISFADDLATNEAVERAAQLAGGHDFVTALPGGYDTLLGEHGFSLSGGQRQRVAIARAILADPRVLILDDATSSVDPTKEHEIRDALGEVMRGRTTIIIAHRPATIALADRVVLIADGKVAAQGSHEALLLQLGGIPAGARASRVEHPRGGARGRGPDGRRGRLRRVAGRGPDPGAGRHRGAHVRQMHGTDEALDARRRRHVVRRTWLLLRPVRGRLALAALFVVLQAAGTLAGPAIIRYGIDSGVQAHDLAALNLATLLFLLAITCVYVFGRLVILTVARLGESFLRDLRERVFAHQMALSLEFFDRNRTGALVARMTADIDSLQELVSQGLSMFIVNLLVFTGAIIAMVAMSWQLALGVLVVVPMLTIASRWYRRASNRAYLHLRDRVGGTLTSFQEGLSGVRVVQAFNQEDAFRRRFRETNDEQFRTHLKAEEITARYTTVIELAQGTAIAVILCFGGWLTGQGVVTVGTLAAFILYLQNLFEPIQQMSQLFNTLQAAGAALYKLYELLDEKVMVDERPGAVDLPADGALEVDGVSFRYATGALVLGKVSLTVASGERVALVGPTGAGKSTLAKLMVRFYDPTAGMVRYGGVDLRDATLRSLRERIIVVPQEGFLFGGTIRDNVLIAKPGASDVDVQAAIDALGLGERFAAFPDGLDTEVRERGANFSAGERQLVSIVRAALADPEIVVLDEATSSLDPGTELIVEHALDRLMEGRTTIVIAHRLSTAARADRVAVVQDGHLAEIGTHAELVAAGGAYTAMYASWTGDAATAE